MNAAAQHGDEHELDEHDDAADDGEDDAAEVVGRAVLPSRIDRTRIAATTARATRATTTRVGMLLPMPAAISAGVWSKAFGPQRVSGTVGTAATSRP